MLAQPVSAQAYTFSFNVGMNSGLQSLARTTNQADLAMYDGDSAMASFSVSGGFMIVPDAGDTAKNVNFKLTSSPTSTTVGGTGTTKFKYAFTLFDTSRTPILSDTYQGDYLGYISPVSSESIIEYFEAVLATSAYYTFSFCADVIEDYGLGGGTVLADWDVSMDVSPTPIPSAVWLLGAGLIGLGGLRRKMKA